MSRVSESQVGLGIRSTYITIDGSDDDGTDHEEPICERDVDLTMEHRRRVNQLYLREVGKLHDLG